MEEIDGIIFFTLKGIGCEFSENETSLANMTQENFIKSVIKCLQKIQPSIKISNTIPRSMSARYQYGITVAEACKKVGYKSDIGYQTILYGNIVDMRRILMFLIEKLPKDTENIVELKSRRFAILKTLKESLSSERVKTNILYSPQHPFVSVPLETGISIPGYTRKCTPAEWKNFCVNNLKFITEQPSDLKCLVPSIITLNVSRLLNIYEFKKANPCASLSQYEETSSNTNVNNVSRKNSEISIAKDSSIFKNVTPKQDSKSSIIEKLIAEKQNLKQLIVQENSNNKNRKTDLEMLKKKYSVHEKSLNIVNNPVIIDKLKNKIKASPEKLEKMKNKWNLYAVEQKSVISELKEELNKKNANNNRLESVYTNEKLKLQTIFDEIKKKENLIKLCRNDLESKSNYNSRSSYTLRILEIISNIEKQKKEINKNLSDTRLVQKDINSLDGKVERCFILIDELMFKVAKKDETIRKCYKLLAAIHANSSSIVQSVKQTGAIRREIKDLEEQIECENARHATTNIQKLKKDMELVQNEQTMMIKKLESLKSCC
ncbi:coiled-coil domain-containing protein 22 [Adelges cooleyi]|uniref:coiled-coil domain-containing protein 22 n=1 Tax=Adelges cooleyi TaxID=133065 RepID=UPI0021802D05|nr:coiled-coil domain-containing protein 22 [Adelges cooleyi]